MAGIVQQNLPAWASFYWRPKDPARRKNILDFSFHWKSVNSDKIFHRSQVISDSVHDDKIALNISSSKDFTSKSTKVELEESDSKLSNVKFPGIAICSPNKVRKSFLLWISKNLNESGHNFLDREINGLIKKAFLGGSSKPLSKKEQNLMNILLKSSFLREYYWSFVAEMNTSTIQSDGTTIQLSNNILNGNIEDIHQDYFLKSSIPKVKRYQEIEPEIKALKAKKNVHWNAI